MQCVLMELYLLDERKCDFTCIALMTARYIHNTEHTNYSHAEPFTSNS